MKAADHDDTQSLPLTEHQLEKSCHDSYKHELLDDKTEFEKEEEARDKAFKREQLRLQQEDEER